MVQSTSGALFRRDGTARFFGEQSHFRYQIRHAGMQLPTTKRSRPSCWSASALSCQIFSRISSCNISGISGPCVCCTRSFSTRRVCTVLSKIRTRRGFLIANTVRRKSGRGRRFCGQQFGRLRRYTCRCLDGPAAVLPHPSTTFRFRGCAEIHNSVLCNSINTKTTARIIPPVAAQHVHTLRESGEQPASRRSPSTNTRRCRNPRTACGTGSCPCYGDGSADARGLRTRQACKYIAVMKRLYAPVPPAMPKPRACRRADRKKAAVGCSRSRAAFAGRRGSRTRT